MARPHKQGLSYFPHDTDASGDGKIHSLMALHGAEGYAFYFILLENIFRTEKGRITCGKLCEKSGLAKAIGITVEKFESILDTALEVGCFDKAVFRTENVLTSNGIQKRIESVIKTRHKDRNRKDLNKFKSYRKTGMEVAILDNNQKTKTKGKGKEIQENPRKTPGKPPENSYFVDFYDKYPKKKNRKSAEKAWLKLNPDENLVKIIVQAVEIAKLTDEWQRDNGQYIPYPASWLNSARWEDQHKVDLPPSTEPLDDGNWYLDSYGIKKMKGT